MKKKEKKTKKVAIRDLKPRKTAGVKGGGSDRNTDFEEKIVIKKP